VLDQWHDPENISYKLRADDGNLYILRQRTSTPDGAWDLFGFAKTEKSVRHEKSAAPGDPHLSSIERKIQNADKYAGNRQDSCGDVGIDQLVQVMEQESAMVWLDSGLGFEPVLQES